MLTATLVAGTAPAGTEKRSDEKPASEMVARNATLPAIATYDAAQLPVPPPVVEGTTHSVGLPFRGRLIDGRKLETSELIRFKDGSPDRERFGTDELVVLLEEAARHVAATFPGAALTVGDLSRERGGPMPPHRSHRNGRDADIVFYALDADGEVAQPDRLVAYGRSGRGRAGDGGRFVFDDARNWELMSYLLDNPIAEVQYIFIAPYLRSRLLAEARRRGEEPWLIAHAELVMKERGGRHHDHFHVRILCPDDDERCRDAGMARAK